MKLKDTSRSMVNFRDRKRLGGWLGPIYAMPAFPLILLMGPLTIVQGIYAKHFGLSLSAIGIVLLFSRLFDAISDPVIGFLSDRYYGRKKTRKPFIFLGGILFIISSYFLYVPVVEATTAYLLVCFIAFYFSYTLFEVPHLSWGAKLNSAYRVKGNIFAWRAFFAFGGSLAFYAIPLLPFFETDEFTPETLRWSVLVSCLIMVPSLVTCLIVVPEFKEDASLNDVIDQKNIADSFKIALDKIINELPFIYFLSAFFCFGVGVGMWSSLIFLFVDVYLLMGESFSLVYVVSFSVGAATLFVWSKIIDRLMKKRVWWVAMMMISIGFIGFGILESGQWALMILVFCMASVYSGFAALNVLAPSLLSDIIQPDLNKTGALTGNESFCFSIYAFVSKTSVALGSGLGLLIAGFYGFDPAMETQSVSAIWGLNLAMVYLPMLFILLSIYFINLIPSYDTEDKICFN